MKGLKFIILFITCLFLISFKDYNNDYDFLVIFKNMTNKKMTGLKISYINIDRIIIVPVILPFKMIEVEIKPTEEFGENQMILNYKDYSGNEHSEILLGYFEKGYKAMIKVDILSIDENGILSLKIKDTLNVY